MKKGKDKIIWKRVMDYFNMGNGLFEKGYKIILNRGIYKKIINIKDNYIKDNSCLVVLKFFIVK